MLQFASDFPIVRLKDWPRVTLSPEIHLSIDSSVPLIRIRTLRDAPVQSRGRFVLYWMTAQRRTTWNFALQRAVDWARHLNSPLLIFEPLRLHGRWVSDRFHRFILQGMADNQAALKSAPALYFPFVEQKHGQGQGLFVALARRATVVVTDDFPGGCFPALFRIASRRCPVRLEAVDSNGLLPLRATDRDFSTAYSFRRFLQKTLPDHLTHFPRAQPLHKTDLPELKSLPRDIQQSWPMPPKELLAGDVESLQALPINHQVGPAACDGGPCAAQQVLKRFLQHRLPRYHLDRNQPEHEAASGLSSYLHFGHISVHDVVARLFKQEKWSPEQLSDSPSGQREGWWGLSPQAERFLDELITWRELGYNMCVHRSDYARYDSLPDWSKKTLAKHACDAREFIYSLEELSAAKTHDDIWNAAQRQLVQEGLMNNYLRMLWGKKILEWTESPQQALRFMIELNNRYAADGQDPNSYSGIFWVLGRYDRAWGPERPVFGTIRYMSSDSTRRKLNLKNYLKRYSESRQQELGWE